MSRAARAVPPALELTPKERELVDALVEVLAADIATRPEKYGTTPERWGLRRREPVAASARPRKGPTP